MHAFGKKTVAEATVFWEQLAREFRVCQLRDTVIIAPRLLGDICGQRGSTAQADS